jgi:hypothetical protein
MISGVLFCGILGSCKQFAPSGILKYSFGGFLMALSCGLISGSFPLGNQRSHIDRHPVFTFGGLRLASRSSSPL